ncbi:C4-dicarboxylate transporter DcuC [Corynebacterium flavescens]|uniref:C4-dicarboxylate transporter DcuC n=2 Tax=Corynebacterium flavescens TaxID=28028 RepID=UPI000ED7255F|nr:MULTISPECIES: C4-dicarboxylate transporter DcuC [Corynebacterium]MDN6099023.1 C4-dicarboxylate transporter DcuC [Corynebacterium flavescens]MDN6199262.1 C4-dicarboxylate transporter DcuC [Corynebacterium flavescens]MDN6226011.1 C4-dicarboxylate transporter DcuC [Corynebacterium flavescens]MDN6431275.1 C4-dicarboxylate transporter DcuC [Corynebacterium flavescens]MDN6474926.1 C4-dicarboxylate transporter DcuC [Corynebacterium flavescens]
MLYLLIAIAAIVAVAWLIYKKVHAAAAIFSVGVILLMLAALTGRADMRTTDIEATGNSFYDQLLVIEALFQSRFSGIGMAIMVLFGFVSYMRHIGADAKAVVILSSPLKRFNGSYWLVPVGFLIGSLLSLVIPSASALSLLLVATLLPALIAAGLSPLTVAAIVVTSSTIIPTPLEAGLIQGAELSGLSVTNYVYGSVAKATIPALLVTAAAHMWWQRRCDKSDQRKQSPVSAGVNASADSEPLDSPVLTESHPIVDAAPAPHHESESEAVARRAVERAEGLPAYYALLPLLPLLLIVVSAVLNRAGIISFEADILPVTVVSLFIALLIEIIRHRSISESISSLSCFFKGLGEGAAGVVSLLIAAAILVEGVTQMGVIDMLIDATEGSSGAAVFIVLIFVLATAVMAALTGSGTAPYFAFSEVVPSLAAETSIHGPQMLTAIWGTSNLMRQVSPVNAAVLIVAGAIKVNPLQLVKRTSVPMVAATIANTLFAFLFIS